MKSGLHGPTPAQRSRLARSSLRHGAAGRRRLGGRPNWAAGVGGFVWLAVIILPLYYVVVTSLKRQEGFYSSNPLLVGGGATLENYWLVLNSGFPRFFANSVIVTLGAVVPAVLIAFMAAYPIVRGQGKIIGATSVLFLMGLAVPLQATIVPVYLIIIKLGLYDTLLALILPSAAFALPISVLILSNFMRDIPTELFESMRLDGASDAAILWRLVLPLMRPPLVTVGVYNAVHVWNGFLFPLILTQSVEQRVLPLSLWTFQGEFTVNVPAVMAAVVLSALPLLIMYIFGRQHLVEGLTAGFGK